VRQSRENARIVGWAPLRADVDDQPVGEPLFELQAGQSRGLGDHPRQVDDGERAK
jgi:hypothetical protein